MKKIITLITLFFTIFILTGCTQVVQLNDRLLVQGIGIDYEDEKYEVTLQVLNVESKGKEENSSENPSKMKVLKSSGTTAMEAMRNIKEKSGKDPLFSQTLIIIIGSDAAKNGLAKFMDLFTRSYEFSPLIEVIIAEGKAFDILNLKDNKEIVSAENILSISKMSSNKNISLESSIGNLISDFKNEYSQAKALYAQIENFNNEELNKKKSNKEKSNSEDSDEKESSKKELLINKIAIFKGDKMFDILDVDMTKGFLLIKSRAKGIKDVIFDEKIKTVTYSIIESKSKSKISKKENLEVNLPIKVKIKLLETDNQLNSDDYEIIKKLIKIRLNNIVTATINKVIKDYELDIFGFSSNYLRKNFFSITKSSNELKEELRNADFKIDVSVNIESDK